MFKRGDLSIGITPFQDTALPVLFPRIRHLMERGVHIRLVNTSWEGAIEALMERKFDAVLYDIFSFLKQHKSLSTISDAPAITRFLYSFHGSALIVRPTDFNFSSKSNDGFGQTDLLRRCAQLRGKRIGVTPDTDFEHLAAAAMQLASIPRSDVQFVYDAEQANLRSFLEGRIDVFAAGGVERVAARRAGATELIIRSDVLVPQLDGFVTRHTFARENPHMIQLLHTLFLRSVNHVRHDMKNHSAPVIEAIHQSKGFRYSQEEYAVAWEFQSFSESLKEADQRFENPTSTEYWRHIWMRANRALVESGQIDQVVPMRHYLAGGR